MSQNRIVSLRDIPARVEPVSTIDPYGPIAKWLRWRGITDFDRLYDDFRVLWTEGYPEDFSDKRSPAIVLPFYAPVPVDDGFGGRAFMDKLVGWEAKFCRERIGQQQRYVMKPDGIGREHLYGLHRAVRGTGPVAVCSWPLDIWKIPLDAIAITGKYPTREKLDDIQTHLRGRDLVILPHFDKLDLASEWREIFTRERQSNGDTAKVLIGKLPEGCPYPSQCSEQELADSIRDALSMDDASAPMPDSSDLESTSRPRRLNNSSVQRNQGA